MVRKLGTILEIPMHLSQGEETTEDAARTPASPSLGHPHSTIPRNPATRTISRQTCTSGHSSWSSEDENSAPPSPPAIVLGMANGVLDNGDAAPRAIEERTNSYRYVVPFQYLSNSSHSYALTN